MYYIEFLQQIYNYSIIFFYFTGNAADSGKAIFPRS